MVIYPLWAHTQEFVFCGIVHKQGKKGVCFIDEPSISCQPVAILSIEGLSSTENYRDVVCFQKLKLACR